MEQSYLGENLILPEVCLPSRINQHWQYSGIDHINRCLDRKHFKSYPYDIEYVYNNRGFRGEDWPSNLNDLRQSIWCVGDSFTVGVGSPYSHSWPEQLRIASHTRVINVSMDGASNEWISRITKKIIDVINPANIVIMWSYTHRREFNNTSLNDEERRKSNGNINEVLDPKLDWENFLKCRAAVKDHSTKIQFAIPYFHPDCDFNINEYWNQVRGVDWPDSPKTKDELSSMPDWILDELNNVHGSLDKIYFKLTNEFPTPVTVLDLARDGVHFDLTTSKWVVSRILPHLV